MRRVTEKELFAYGGSAVSTSHLTPWIRKIALTKGEYTSSSMHHLGTDIRLRADYLGNNELINV